jgi:hypothetical protein
VAVNSPDPIKTIMPFPDGMAKTFLIQLNGYWTDRNMTDE